MKQSIARVAALSLAAGLAGLLLIGCGGDSGKSGLETCADFSGATRANREAISAELLDSIDPSHTTIIDDPRSLTNLLERGCEVQPSLDLAAAAKYVIDLARPDTELPNGTSIP